MKKLSIFFALIIFSNHTFASTKACDVYKTWLQGKTAKEICLLNKGNFCTTVQNKGQGICFGAEGQFCNTVQNIGQGVCLASNGNFCNTVENVAQGICLALKENSCRNLTVNDEKTLIEKLTKFCHLEIITNIHDENSSI